MGGCRYTKLSIRIFSKQGSPEILCGLRDNLALYKLMYHTSPTTELYLPRKYKLFSKAMHTLYPNAAVV